MEFKDDTHGTQRTVGDLTVFLDAIERAYGADVPLWLVAPGLEGGHLMMTLVVPCLDLRLTTSAGSPALLLVAAGVVLPELPDETDELLARDRPAKPRRRWA